MSSHVMLQIIRSYPKSKKDLKDSVCFALSRVGSCMYVIFSTSAWFFFFFKYDPNGHGSHCVYTSMNASK